jgi:hypothetical protein
MVLGQARNAHALFYKDGRTLLTAHLADWPVVHGQTTQPARIRALAAYKDFLTLWKDADPDIPILKQAKAEYAKLQ